MRLWRQPSGFPSPLRQSRPPSSTGPNQASWRATARPLGCCSTGTAALPPADFGTRERPTRRPGLPSGLVL
eukprot:4726458-Lingulodinium_polyedra.AAC.1